MKPTNPILKVSALFIFVALASCKPQAPEDVVATLNAGVGGGEVEATATMTPLPTATATNTPIPSITPTPTSTPWVFPTAVYDDDEWPYGIPTLLSPVQPAWEDGVEVYVLLGSDYSSWRQNLTTGTDNTDAFIIMIVNTNLEPPSISVISIPRDLYVFIPGHGMNRINTAWKIGGEQAVADTIRYNFGLPMDGYGYVRMEAFSRFIDDALHGINVEVRKGVLDHCSNIRFNLGPGTHFMDGPKALCYARIRKWDGGFNRQSRQHEVLLAMKEAFLEEAENDPIALGLKIITSYSNEYRYTSLKASDVLRLIPTALDAEINEYQMNYDQGLVQLTHPVTRAWLLVPPDPACMSTLMWVATMGEPWSEVIEDLCFEP